MSSKRDALLKCGGSHKTNGGRQKSLHSKVTTTAVKMNFTKTTTINIPLSRVFETLQKQHEDTPCCETVNCTSEVWAACITCQCSLCFQHFEESSPCHLRNNFVPAPAPQKPDCVVVDLEDVPLYQILSDNTNLSQGVDIENLRTSIVPLFSHVPSSVCGEDAPEPSSFVTIEDQEQRVPVNPLSPQPEDFIVEGS